MSTRAYGGHVPHRWPRRATAGLPAGAAGSPPRSPPPSRWAPATRALAAQRCERRLVTWPSLAAAGIGGTRGRRSAGG